MVVLHLPRLICYGKLLITFISYNLFTLFFLVTFSTQHFELKVKNLLTIHPQDEVPVKNVTIRRIPRY